MKFTQKLAVLMVPALMVIGFSASSAVAESSPKHGIVAAYTLVVPSSIAKSHLQVRAVIPNGVACPTVTKTYANGYRSESPMTLRAPGATTGQPSPRCAPAKPTFRPACPTRGLVLSVFRQSSKRSSTRSPSLVTRAAA